MTGVVTPGELPKQRGNWAHYGEYRFIPGPHGGRSGEWRIFKGETLVGIAKREERPFSRAKTNHGRYRWNGDHPRCRGLHRRYEVAVCLDRVKGEL
jgi:hypothetical protein